jgi:Ni/Fe-hydrogenase 1 B-type cytochrome subunit
MDIRKKYVYDLITRITHAGIGFSILLLLATSQLARFFYENGQLRHLFWVIHIYSGYLLIGFFLMRIVWFFKGPKYSRLSNFIKIKEWKQIFISKKIKWGWGHHPMAALAYLLLYATIAFLIYSGLFLARIQFDQGPISEKYFDEMNLLKNFLENHNTASWLVIIFTITHLGALIFHQIKDRVPIFKSMRTGYQYKRKSFGDLENERD